MPPTVDQLSKKVDEVNVFDQEHGQECDQVFGLLRPVWYVWPTRVMEQARELGARLQQLRRNMNFVVFATQCSEKRVQIMVENFNKLESAVLAWYRSRYKNGNLSAQIDSARFIRRVWTKVGFYVYLEVPAGILPINSDYFQGEWSIEGPNIQSPGVQYGGGSLLCGKNGFITYLELYAFGDQFDEDVTEFILSS